MVYGESADRVTLHVSRLQRKNLSTDLRYAYWAVKCQNKVSILFMHNSHNERCTIAGTVDKKCLHVKSPNKS